MSKISKQFLALTFAFIALFFVSSCKKDEVEEVEAPIIEENGLSREINDLVPEETIVTMQDMGMPVYRGANPPTINGNFLISPMLLFASTNPTEDIGHRFNDFDMTFGNQNNQDYTIQLDFVSGSSSGIDVGSYIVGENGRFTMFGEVITTSNGVKQSSLLYVISGSAYSNGMKDTYLAIFMLDDFGDPSGTLIDVGQGRVFHDEDGFCEGYTYKNLRKDIKILNDFAKLLNNK